MNCPSCGAPMRLEAAKDGLACEYCRNFYFPEKDDEGVSIFSEASGDSCPVCAVPLMNASLAKVRILYCTRCRGMLVPMDVFITLVEELRAGQPGSLIPPPPDPNELHRKLDCPHCHKPMDTHFYSGAGNVIIEDCDVCELNWLDHGKLMRIVRAPDYSYRNAEPMA
ncbi:MAG: zf-TFIIB domain-containing protein [Terracidiphilus sp.]